jgi:predicted Zn-dependent peptidase
VQGDLESVAKVDRADLLLAQDRFLHSDNAALVVIGGVERARLMRVLRQLLGPWENADRSVSQTFRQPNAPDARTLLINQTGNNNAEVRLALRGLARSDRDCIAASILSQIARQRWQAAVPELSSASVRHEAHTLPGMFVFAATVPAAAAQKALTAAQEVMKTLAETGPSAAELERAAGAALAEAGKRGGELDSIADLWLDSEIYKTSLTVNPASEISRLSIADIQRVAARLFKDAAQARIVVGDVEQLKSNINNIEIPGTKPDSKPNVKTATDPQLPPKKP